ncbi:hypothetical protein [Paraburkholderia sp. BL10I2N1]|uniref:hypothetical protein n=1 Tax=Paraburkholderia sp. BL10I2N1 TaxID=1938796 RepID=UPI0010DFE438|nr:hypothetical protein [Paraburkholderia sp. BL10I2N1]TDN62004.1 hypothetical protein B0G77_5521 [Paraburkholderia sp. BL10I2N1]TDN62067.1 hypothetical protein B0G77_5586 [Paraburkholderia sp. BL10I2N1]
MANTRSLQLTGFDWLANGPLAPHIDAFKRYLTERGHATTTFTNCLGSVPTLVNGCTVTVCALRRLMRLLLRSSSTIIFLDAGAQVRFSAIDAI